MPKVLSHFIKPRSLVSLASIGLFFLYASPCFSETTATAEWNISADKITKFENPESIVAEGNIVLQKREKLPPQLREKPASVSSWAELLEEPVEDTRVTPDDLPAQQQPRFETRVTIKADWIAYDVENESIRARGNVSIETADDTILAEEAEVDLTKEIGNLEQATIVRKDNQLHLEGEKIEKTGVKTYRIEDGWVITCKLEEGEIPPWSFSSSEATIEQGGYAVLKNARFNVKEVPIFYLPYLIVPVKDSRQTGLLLPEITNSSRDGFGFNLPLFLNLSESIDATLFAEYYSDRGFMPGAEFRYVLNDSSKGKFSGNYLSDDLSDSDEVEYYADTGFTHTNTDRYWVRGKADHDFGDSFIARLDLDIVSDRDYLTEFSSGLTGFNTSQKEYLKSFGRGFENQDDDQRNSSLRFLKSWSTSSLNIDLTGVNDVRVVESSPTPLWTLPAIDYSGALPILDSSFTFDWDADYVNYWREDGVGGHRVDLFPKLSAPVPVGQYLESRAEVGLRGTFYSIEEYGDGVWTENETPSRILGTFHTDLATTLLRDFQVADYGYSTLRHSVRPFVEYDYISEDDDDVLPEFDSVDEIEETNSITYGVDSFFNLYDTADNYARQYGYIRLSQSYDLRSEASDEPYSPITLKLGWMPLSRMFLGYKAEFPVEDDQNTVHGLEGYFTNSRGDSFALDYRYNEDENIEQINASFKTRILPVLEAEFAIEHSLEESETNESTLALTYIQQCWSVQLKAQYTPTDERIAVVFNLANIGLPIGVNF